MSEMSEWITKFATSHATMHDIIEKIDPMVEIYPGWGIRQIIAHLAGWEEASADSLSSFIQGGTPDVVVLDGDDAYNAESVQKRDSLSLEETIQDWEEHRNNLISVLGALADEQLEARIAHPWGGEDSIAKLLGGLVWHENHHVKEIQEFLGPTT